jgi:tRNA(adenine34) deaminase
MIDDSFFMKEALKEAELAFKKKEVPVGAVLVFEGQIIARAHNQTETLQDATAHAEMLCLKTGSATIGNWRLSGTVLYSTLEPCVMCAGACFLSRIKKIVWAAPDLRVGANGSWVDLFSQSHPIHKVTVSHGVFATEAGALMQAFFSERRKLRSK